MMQLMEHMLGAKTRLGGQILFSFYILQFFFTGNSKFKMS